MSRSGDARAAVEEEASVFLKGGESIAVVGHGWQWAGAVGVREFGVSPAHFSENRAPGFLIVRIDPVRVFWILLKLAVPFFDFLPLPLVGDAVAIQILWQGDCDRLLVGWYIMFPQDDLDFSPCGIVFAMDGNRQHAIDNLGGRRACVAHPSRISDVHGFRVCESHVLDDDFIILHISKNRMTSPAKDKIQVTGEVMIDFRLSS